MDSEASSLIPKNFYKFGVEGNVVSMPVKIAITNNFYEYYFLIWQSCGFQCSDRFRYEINPEKYAFIPRM